MKNEATIPDSIATPKFSDLPYGSTVWLNDKLYIKIFQLGQTNAIRLDNGLGKTIEDNCRWFSASVKIVDDPQEFNA